MKTFNIYCDESCHLENDNKKYMIIGSISSAYNQVQLHSQRIKEFKEKYGFYGEIKWSKVSSSMNDFYLDLIDYFFATDLNYRAIVVAKKDLKINNFNLNYDEFYYKMYYQLLNYNKKSEYKYNVFIDIKDSKSSDKVLKLRDILNIRFGVFNIIQNIRSHESLLLQLADLITGAISYQLNVDDKKV